MYDIKYAPFADSYIGMAHGDTYEHVKRWLKQRFTFVDTLFDYAPSYNNDVLTIRANTTELMTLEIETYTPVYQHLSWYNGQMDKKKIDGKVSVEFSGTAQAATDQEVLIYGGSNVKSIKGITSMNPNRMLIGSATKLIEIDAHDCPLLADINANKANLSPHEYLNKVNLSNCPLLEGNLRLNNSPLVQEINIKGTKITGMNLPSSIRNLQILRLPNTMTDLTLNDASMLHTLEFDEGVNLQSISMTNCNALENVINFDLLQTLSITLNNSYNTVAELYFKDTTNLSLSNMSNLERVIYTPNNEYETFELINVANAPDYTVTTFNCPKLSTFMTTAPYRESYNDCGMKDKEIIHTEELLDGTYEMGGFWSDTGTYTAQTTYRMYEANIPSDADELIINIELTTADSSIILHYFEDDTFISRLVSISASWSETVTKPSNCNKVIISVYDSYFKSVSLTYNKVELIQIKDYGDIQPNTTFTANSIDISSTQFTDVKLLCTTDTNTLKLPTTVKNFYCDSSFDLDTDYLEDGEYDVVHGELIEQYTTDYEGEVLLNDETPNIIPSSADGSLIFSMYTPNNTVAPASGTWDLYGLEFDNFYTFGMNNDVKTNYFYEIMKNGTGNFTMPTDCTSLYFKNTSNNTIIVHLMKHSSGLILMNNYSISAGEEFTLSVSSTYRNSQIDYSIKNIQNQFDLIVIKNDSEGNITMPARYDDYNITIKNAYIAPKTHNTMLYPLLVNEENPITGTLDYTNYTGKHLSWSFAYTDEEYVNITQPKDELLNSYEYRYNAFYQTEYEFDNPYEVARYTSSASGVLPNFNDQFTYTYEEIDNGDGTYTTKVYADDLDNLPTSINFISKPIISVDKLNTSQATNLQGLFQSCSKLERVDARYWDTSKVITMRQAFFGTNSLTSLDLSNLDTSNVNDMANMFHTCSVLTSLDVSNFNTSNVTIMSGMFYGCNNLTSLGVSGFNTSKVINMGSMFYGCSGLTSLDLSGFNTSNVTTMDNMFRDCSNLAFLDLSNFDTSNVTAMNDMFKGCNNLASLDLSNFDTNNVTAMNNMFHSCNNLTSLDLSGFDTSNVTNMAHMFSGCSNLTSLDLSGFNTSNVTNMEYMFYVCKGLTSLDISGFDTSKVTSMGAIFQNCNNLTSLDLSGFDTSNVTNMAHMFRGCSNLTSLDVSGFDTSKVTSMDSMFYNCINLTSLNLSNWSLDKVNTIISQLSVSPSTSILYGTVVIDESTLPSGWVYEFNDLFVVAIYKVNTSGARMTIYPTDYITQSELDNGDGTYTVTATTSDLTQTPTNISVPSDKTSLVEIVKLNGDKIINWGGDYESSGKFANCTNLINININWGDMSDVTSLGYLFSGCTKLEKVDMSYLDFSSLTSVKRMFYECDSLKEVDFTGCKGDKISNIGEWFYGCGKLEQIKGLNSLGVKVIKANLSSCPAISSAFAYCTKLKTLDLSNWVLSYCYTAKNLFTGCSSLTEIIGLNTLSLFTEYWTEGGCSIAEMFYGCSSLTNLDFTDNNWGWSYVGNMNRMFYNCTNLTSLNLSDFNTSKVTNMSSMFNSCSGLTSLDVSGFDTSKVTDMSYMFNNCKSLTSLDVSGFDTSNVTTMQSMFNKCNNLISLNVSNFNTSKVTNMNSMFYDCSGLTSLDLSEFDTSQVTSMNSMFYDCNNLASLDVSGFNISNVTNMVGMFSNCISLMELDSMQNISVSLDLSYTILDITSLLDVIDNLATITTTKTLTLGSTLLAKLTEDQIAIATNKGWTVA